MADNQPMSQDDIDSLLAQMSGGGESAPAAKPAPAPAAKSTAPGMIDQAEMDLLVAQGAQDEAPAAPAPAPAPVAPAAVASTSLDQGDIDQLLSSLGVDDGSHGSGQAVPPPAASPVKPTRPPAATAPAPAPGGPLGQDDIDALLGQLQEQAAPAAEPAAATPAPGWVGFAPKQEWQQPAAAPAAPASGPLGQDDIDALVNQVASGAASAAAPAPAPAAAAPSGPLGQDDIDALVNSMAAAPAAPATASPEPAPSGPLGQDDIDALVNQLASSDAAPPAPAAQQVPLTQSGSLGQDDIDALVSQLAVGEPAPAAEPAAQAKSASPAVAAAVAAKAQAEVPPAGVDPDIFEGRLDQDKIDRLLSQLGADTAVKAPGTATPAKAPASPGVTASTATAMASPLAGAKTIALSNEDLDALVAKHSSGDGGASSETMIAQADIDALVQQLSGAGGGEPEPAAKQAVTKALAKHDAAIDKLLSKDAGDAARATVDALDPRIGGDKRPGSQAAPTVTMPSPVAAPAAPHPAITAMAPAELRGARVLLAAAVFLLAVCASTLVVVTSAIHGLSGELKAERLSQLNPSGDFGEDWKVALAHLEDPDPDQQSRGVHQLERLRGRYPGHEAEIALVLARYHRGQGEWKRSSAQYASLLEGAARLMDDPRIYLEYAEVLDRTGERPAAVRQVYTLLANELAWTGERDLRRIPRPAREVAANRLVMQEANLLLGRLVGETQAPAVASAGGRAAPAGGHAPAAAHGGGH
ncbi:MAG: hypothetical protein L6R48_16350 [Planctomycetes bacterium]|nr:hypothetical protein [Planctomycetota bacterium]